MQFLFMRVSISLIAGRDRRNTLEELNWRSAGLAKCVLWSESVSSSLHRIEI